MTEKIDWEYEVLHLLSRKDVAGEPIEWTDEDNAQGFILWAEWLESKGIQAEDIKDMLYELYWSVAEDQRAWYVVNCDDWTECNDYGEDDE